MQPPDRKPSTLDGMSLGELEQLLDDVEQVKGNLAGALAVDTHESTFVCELRKTIAKKKREASTPH